MRTILSLILAGIIGAMAGRADDSSAGFKPLFNGKDLTGWKYNKEDLTGKTETADKRFSVVDGVIVANEGKGIRDLTTVAEFNGAFVLKLEFRASPKSDSGVYVRGPQLQVRDYIRRGEQKALANVFKNDDWNELEISVTAVKPQVMFNKKLIGPEDQLELTVRKGTPSAKLNGVDMPVESVILVQAADAVCKLNGVEFEKNYKPGAKGGIGLQAETGKFEFRNIRIKELP